MTAPGSPSTGAESEGAPTADALARSSDRGRGSDEPTTLADGSPSDPAPAVRESFSWASILRWVSRALPVPGAFYAATSSLAAGQNDPVESAETAFLGLLGTAVLTAMMALASAGEPADSRKVASPRGAGIPAAIPAALLALTTLWLVHQGAQRGAVFSLLLLGGLASATFQTVARLGLQSGNGASRPHGHGAPWAEIWRPEVVIPVAVGLQLLCRPELLLPPLIDLRALVSLLVLPVVSALALGYLATRFQPHRAFAVAALAVSIVPGWNVTSCLALVAVASGAWAGDLRHGKISRRGAVLAVLLCGGALAVYSLPAVGLCVALGGGAVGLIHGRDGSSPLSGVDDPSADDPSADDPSADDPSADDPFAGILTDRLADPETAELPTSPGGRRWLGPSLMAGLILCWVGLRADGDLQSMLPGLALLALVLPASSSATAGASRATFHVGALLLGWGALSGGYPWLRPDPWRTALAELGRISFLGPVAIAAVFLLGSAGVIYLASALRRPSAGGWRAGQGVGSAMLLTGFGVVVGLLVLATLPRGQTLDVPAPASFDSRPFFEVDLDGSPMTRVLIDTHLIHAAGLPNEQPVLWIQLQDEVGTVLASWRVLNGRDTAEWAAGRADVAKRPGFVAPEAFLYNLAADGRFFARRYRSTFRSKIPVAAHRIAIGRPASLPEEVKIRIHRLEIRP